MTQTSDDEIEPTNRVSHAAPEYMAKVIPLKSVGVHFQTSSRGQNSI